MIYVRREKFGDIAFIPELGCHRELEPILASHNVHVKEADGHGRLLSAPLQIVVYPSLTCNVRCPFCYLPTHSSQSMSDTTIRSVLSYMSQNYIGRIQILGGEPFHPSVYPVTNKLIDWSAEYPEIQEITLTTNGYFLDRVDLELMIRREVAINVSIHGVGQRHNEALGIHRRDLFGKIAQNMRLLEKYGRSIQICTVVTTQNIDYLHEIRDFLFGYSNILSWTWLYPNERETSANRLAPGLRRIVDAYEQMKDDLGFNVNLNMPFQYKFRRSSQPVSTFEKIACRCSTIDGKKLEVMPDGTVYHCAMFFGDQRFALGNINDGFDLADNGSKVAHVLPATCSGASCEYFENCYGCPGWALAQRKINR